MSPPVFPFIVGCPRSGTTLVRHMLDAHPEVAVPPESHFVPRLAARFTTEPFTVGAYLSELVTCGWIELSGLDLRELRDRLEAAAARNLAGAVRATYELYAGRFGKRLYADKTPKYVLNLDLVTGLFPEARFLHVVRDGRAVALSLLEQGWGPSDLLTAAYYWRRHVAAGLAFERAHPSRCLRVSYEELISDPRCVLKELCGFLGISYSEDMLGYMRTTRPGRVGTRSSHLSRGPGLTRDWSTQMSAAELGAFELVAGASLRALGYERRAADRPPPARIRGGLTAARLTLTALRRPRGGSP